MCASQSRFDDRVALRVERDRRNRCPVARLARPARRVLLPGLLVQRMACTENGVVFTVVALGRADVLDAAVAVIVVVPMHACSPASGKSPASRWRGPVAGFL